jgi:hypothetical protein
MRGVSEISEAEMSVQSASFFQRRPYNGRPRREVVVPHSYSHYVREYGQLCRDPRSQFSGREVRVDSANLTAVIRMISIE